MIAQQQTTPDMPVDMPTDIQGAFRALADPSRRTMLMLLGERDMTIGEVADHFNITRAAIKKHLTILEEGHLISVRPRGRERINRLQPLALKQAASWFDYFNRFWDEKLDNLKTAIESEQGNKK